MTITQEPRFLSEDVVLYSRDGSRKLILKLHAGQRPYAERIVESLLQLGATDKSAAADPNLSRQSEPLIEVEAEVVG